MSIHDFEQQSVSTSSNIDKSPLLTKKNISGTDEGRKITDVTNDKGQTKKKSPLAQIKSKIQGWLRKLDEKQQVLFSNLPGQAKRKLYIKLDILPAGEMFKKTNAGKEGNLYEEALKSKDKTLNYLGFEKTERTQDNRNPLHSEHYDIQNGITYSEEKITTIDNKKLDGMVMKHDPKDTPAKDQKWIINLGGNGECWQQNLEQYHNMAKATGANLLCCNYRGVMDSTGYVRKSNDLKYDGVAMVEHLRKLGVDPKNICLCGHSLGGGVAALTLNHFEEQDVRLKAFFDRTFSVNSNVIVPNSKILQKVLAIVAKIFSSGISSESILKNILKNGGDEQRFVIAQSESDNVIEKGARLHEKMGTVPHVEKQINFVSLSGQNHNTTFDSRQFNALKSLLNPGSSLPKNEGKLEKLKQAAIPIIKGLLEKRGKPVDIAQISKFIEEFPEKKELSEDFYTSKEDLPVSEENLESDFFYVLLEDYKSRDGSGLSTNQKDLSGARNLLKEAYDKLNEGPIKPEILKQEPPKSKDPIKTSSENKISETKTENSPEEQILDRLQMLRKDTSTPMEEKLSEYIKVENDLKNSNLPPQIINEQTLVCTLEHLKIQIIVVSNNKTLDPQIVKEKILSIQQDIQQAERLMSNMSLPLDIKENYLLVINAGKKTLELRGEQLKTTAGNEIKELKTEAEQSKNDPLPMPTKQEKLEEEEFVQTVINQLTGPQGQFTVAKNGEIFFKAPQGKSTGQNIKSLTKMLTTAYKSVQTGEKLIAIRMKYGSVKQNTGKTFIYAFDLQGNQVYTSEKIKFLGAGAFGAAYAYQTKEGQEALKLAKTRDTESRELLGEGKRQQAVRDVQNEGEMLDLLHTDENGKPLIIPGLQLPPKNKIVIIKGTMKKGRTTEEKTKIGYISVKYSGDCFPGEKIGGKPWAEQWGSKNLLNGVKDLGNALEHCHKMKVFLGDIKPENIFRNDKEKKVYLADLGGAIHIQEKKDIPGPGIFTATPGYSSRQDLKLMLNIQERASKGEKEKLLDEYKELKEKIDVHALGVSIFEMLVPNIDFSGQIWENQSSANFTRNNISNYLEKANLPKKTAKALGSLLAKMTDPNPKKRPTSAEANKILQSIEFA